MENKLFDLDPYQINNHLEKSLYLQKNKPEPVYRKYEDIIRSFEKTDSFLCRQFIEYLVILGYSKIDYFGAACRADIEIRNKLVKNIGEEILDFVHKGKKDKRDKETCRCHLEDCYDYLSEINLAFRKEQIELWLSFGAKQNGARKMFSKIDKVKIEDENLLDVYTDLHLNYARGKIIKNLYINNWDLDDYIQYWKNNIEFIKQSSPSETINLYEKLYQDGKVDNNFYNKVKEKICDKKLDLYIIPEISIVYKWTYQEAANFGLEKFKKRDQKQI